MNLLQETVVSVLVALPLSSTCVTVLWWFTFRTVGWPFNWRLTLWAPAYWRWVARTLFPNVHKPVKGGWCACGRRRCTQLSEVHSGRS